MKAIYDGHTKPTRIMYRSNLNWDSLNLALDLLIEKTYISFEQIPCKNSNAYRTRYSVTEKGIVALRDYRKTSRHFNLNPDRFEWWK